MGPPEDSSKPRIKMQLYKTEPCQNWAVYGMCRYGNLCKFAHGLCEQRSRLRHPMYKTSLCKDFPLGKCTFGSRCNFAHSIDELRSSLPASPIAAEKHQPQHQPQPQHHHFQPPQQLPAMLIQTPVSVLPDGRTVSTFTPLPTGAGGGDQDDAHHLRRYQSAGALRQPSVDAGAGAGGAAAGAATPLRQRRLLQPAISGAAFHAPGDGIQSAFASAFASPTQSLLHLHQAQGNIARRVASLSQLPSLRSSPALPPASPMVGAPAPGAMLATGSPLAYQSPIFSPPSPGESDTASDAWLGQQQGLWSQPRRALTSSTSMQALPRLNPQAVSPRSPGELDAAAFGHYVHDPVLSAEEPSGQQYLRPTAGRTLTTSISMQALPRFKAPVPWDTPAPAGNFSGPQFMHMASAQSSATLIESDVWAATSSAHITPEPTKPHDSRFFPSEAAVPRAMPAPLTVAHRELRRQQSTDDWALMRGHYDPTALHLELMDAPATSNIYW